jgi:hypothetical protein
MRNISENLGMLTGLLITGIFGFRRKHNDSEIVELVVMLEKLEGARSFTSRNGF